MIDEKKKQVQNAASVLLAACKKARMVLQEITEDEQRGWTSHGNWFSALDSVDNAIALATVPPK